MPQNAHFISIKASNFATKQALCATALCKPFAAMQRNYLKKIAQKIKFPLLLCDNLRPLHNAR
jgi:hypothetical protein